MSAATAPASSHAFPDWFQQHLDGIHAEIRGWLEPYPFQHPSDVSSYVCLHENDYLRLSRRPEVLEARHRVLDASGSGQIASSLFSGGQGASEHELLRAALASAMQSQDTLLATSGWAANVGLIDALAAPGTPIYLDQNAHASLWDGARISQGHAVMVRHNDPESLERRIRRDGPGIVCIDSWYSSSGTVAPLAAIVDLCERHDCLLVLDEAHSFGMTGPLAGGMAVADGLAARVPFRTCSFSKALGGHGGFVAASHEMIWHLSHFQRSVVFSSATTPSDAAAHRAALQIAQAEPELAANAIAMAERFRQKLTWLGIKHIPSQCQIVSIPLEAPQLASRLYAALRDNGVLASVFLPPAIPKGTGLVRFTFHAHIDENAVDWTAQALRRALESLAPEAVRTIAA
jgi:CAI-1 autoinducer synthase